MLKDMHSLLKGGNLSNETLSKIIILGYNLVDQPVKRISLTEKFKAVVGSSRLPRPSLTQLLLSERRVNDELDNKNLTLVLNNYPENNLPLNILFLLGIILGDGNFSIRIRDTGKGLWFIPLFRIYQKNTLINKKLLDNIENFLKGFAIKSHITMAKENGRLLCLSIEGKASVKAFYSLLSEHSKWFFWKKRQFSPLLRSTKYFTLSNVASRHWKTGQLVLLKEIFSNAAFPKKAYNFEFYKNKLEVYFKNRMEETKEQSIGSEGLTKEDLFYITMSKDKSWMVTLPTALKIKPKSKYFFFKTYQDNKDKALRAAIGYRDNSLNNWLIDNGFKVK